MAVYKMYGFFLFQLEIQYGCIYKKVRFNIGPNEKFLWNYKLDWHQIVHEYSLDVGFYEFCRKIPFRKIFILQEEKRTDRQNQIFQEFKKRTARAHNTMDEK